MTNLLALVGLGLDTQFETPAQDASGGAKANCLCLEPTVLGPTRSVAGGHERKLPAAHRFFEPGWWGKSVLYGTLMSTVDGARGTG